MGVTVAALLDRGLIERARNRQQDQQLVLSITEAADGDRCAGTSAVRGPDRHRSGGAARRVQRGRAPPARRRHGTLFERLAGLL